MASDGEISCTNDPNFAVIYSFLKVFGKLYGLEVPTIAELQEFIENTQEVLDPLKEIHLRLLRRALKSVQSNRWERGLIKFCHQHGHHQEAWEVERFSYKKASTQVKLKVLKLLLEYQFTCHPKFKTAVNAISCKELRLDPIGRDKNGCVYWYQVDHDANLCLFKEDQDEETWQLVARNREELVKVISQLKNREEICPLVTSNTNEDSSSAEVPPQMVPTKPETEEDNEDEFLSPESESEHEADDQADRKSSEKETSQVTETERNEQESNENNMEDAGSKKVYVKNIEDNKKNTGEDELKKDIELNETPIESKNESTPMTKDSVDSISKSQNENVTETIKESAAKSTEESTTESIKESSPTKSIKESSPPKSIRESSPPKSIREATPPKIIKESSPTESVNESCENINKVSQLCAIEDVKGIASENVDQSEETKEVEKNNIEVESVSDTIEEPVMIVTGEGNGADCESSYIIGEEIIEEVMYFFGEGCGYDNDTGNPEAVEQENVNENTDEENGNEECVNGEHDISSISNKAKLGKGIKLRSSLSSVNKRTLKKQNNDTTEVPKPETKKHCIRNLEKSDSLIKSAENERESSVNDKSTDSESPRKNNVKKGRGNVKKKRELHKIKMNDVKEVLNSVSETDNGDDSKASIIEKRKSSVSSVDQDEHDHTETEKEKSPDKEDKVEDTLPPKKLRLESTPESDVNASHSKETVDNVNNSESNEKLSQGNDNVEDIENSVSQRKKIKANKGKFKRKKVLKNKAENDSVVDKITDKDKVKDKKGSKSLKRTLLNTTTSDRNKSESQSDSEEDEPVTIGKRLKIKPKKIITSLRKKVEAKLSQKHSSDESEEETLYSIAGKKSTKKVLKKKPKGKEKQKETKKAGKGQSEDSDVAPVRQSRRIAQMKIKEEADRRHQEEVALREMKMIHKKKNKDDEEEWQASGSSSEGPSRGRPKKDDKWRAADSTGPEPDSDTDEPLFEHVEPDLDYTNKSDHEFSPESDLESGEPVEPLKRARTLREDKEEGGACERCGSGEQPEWILLCDRCDAGYHASCLKPLLLLVPEGCWYCPPCNHDMLISSLESELTKYDELVVQVEAERAERAKQQQQEKQSEDEKKDEDKKSEKSSHSQSDGEGSSSDWSSSSSGAVYRLRARKQLPVSYRSQEYDRLISSAIKEEYVEPTTSAGNQGRGKDISTIIEAAEEEKLKAEREAIEQGRPIEIKKLRKKARRKPRKLNSLEVPSEDDDETDEDFKDTGMESSSEEISSSADRDSSAGSGSSDSLPIARRTGRTDRKDRPKMTESSPEVKKKKKVFEDTSSESGGTKEWSKETKKSKSKSRLKKRDKSKKCRKRGGLTQYDAAGNVIRARVTYGGLSDDEPNDWSPKHRTRQKKINYTEMPNTESEDEMHKSSGKHMPDSSDEFKIDDSDVSSSDSDRAKKRKPEGEGSDAERQKAISDLIKKTAVVPLEKLPEDVTKAKTEELEELQAQLNAQQQHQQQQQQAPTPRAGRGRGARGGRGRGAGGAGAGRGRGRSPRALSPAAATDDALAKLVGVKIKDLKTDVTLGRPNEAEREKKRQEREAKQAEKEARKLERLQKKEEKEKLKELKAKEREEKRLARLALHESKRLKKEKSEYQMPGPMGFAGIPIRASGPDMQRMNMFGNTPIPVRHPGDYQEQRFPQQPRLQVRAELRGVAGPEERLQALRPDHPMREGTLSVAGSPQPFKPVSEEPSIITRMPHMINQQYRGPMMYSPGNSPYGPRGQNMMYPMHHPGMNPQARHQYPGGYYPPHLRGLPPAYSPGGRPAASPQGPHASPGPPGPGHSPGMHGPPGPGHSPGMHGPPGSGHSPGMHGPLGPGPHGPLGPPGLNQHGPPGRPHGPPGPGPHGHPGPHPGQVRVALGPGAHGLQGPLGAPRPPPHGSPGPGPLAGHNSMPHPSKMVLSGPRAPPPPAPATPPGAGDPPVRIKAEVKTEPEYRSPPASPRPASPRDEPPRNHPKIKHTENKDRRPRHPLGPYAPQYGPYGPYAPAGPPPPPAADGHAPLLGLQPRPPAGGQHPLQRMQQLHRLLPTPDPPERPPYGPAGLGPRAGPPGPAPAPYAEAARPAPVEPPGAGPPAGSPPPPAPAPPAGAPAERKPTPPPPRSPPVVVKLEEPRDEGSVFGGLVSYFSSQREDDMDA